MTRETVVRAAAVVSLIVAAFSASVVTSSYSWGLLIAALALLAAVWPWAASVRLPLSVLMTPAPIILGTVLLSAAAWAAPLGDDVRRGFSEREPIGIQSALLLGGWYGVLALSTTAAFLVGRRIRPMQKLDATPDAVFYYLVSLVAAVGTVYSYLLAVGSDPGVIIELIETRQYNLLRNELPYGTGLHTLRYAAIVSGGIALYYLASRRELRLIHLWNVAVLIAAAALSSRLSLTVAFFVVIGCMLRAQGDRSPTLAVVLLGVYGLFLLSIPLNYVRNAGFYTDHYGVTDPVAMNVQEIVAYLGAPFQGSMATARHATSGDSGDHFGPGETLYTLAVPTYLLSDERQREIERQSEQYRTYTTIEPELVTNSAFTQLYSWGGMAAIWLVLLVVTPVAALVGHLLNYRSLLMLAGPVVLYCFAEVWRLYLFTSGIIHFLVAMLFLISVAYLSGRAVLRTASRIRTGAV